MNALRRWRDEVAELDVLDVTARLTLLLVLLYGGESWDVELPVRILAVIGLIDTRLLRHPTFWLILTVALAVGNVRRILLVDNHKILLVYWCFAVTLCMRARSAPALAHNARLLIGLAFGFATFWKLASPDFADGTFFTYAIVVGETRFADLAVSVGGLTPEQLSANTSAVLAARAGQTEVASLAVTDSVRALAFAMTWWTILIEGAIAVVFLLPKKLAFVDRVRNPLLLVFLVTTYPLATVTGFGWQLALLGYAQTADDQRWSRLAFLGAIPLLLLSLVPWGALWNAL